MQFQERIRLDVNKKSISICIVQLVVILATLFLLTIPVHAATLNNWHLASSIPYKTPYYDVTYGNGVYVTVGNAGKILYSRDGESWTQATKPTTTDPLHGVTCGNGTFVAVGNGGTILTSINGSTWTQKTSPAPAGYFSGVTYGENVFVVVGDSGNMVVSSNLGESWVKVDFPDNSVYLRDVTYGNGKFNAIDNKGSVWSSSTPGVGNSWAKQVISTTGLTDISYGNGVLIVSDDNRTIWRSINGGPWTSTSTSDADNILGSTYGNGKFVSVGISTSQGIVRTSDDQGINWDSLNIVQTWHPYPLHAVTYGNNKYIAVSSYGDIFVTTDISVSGGTYWTTQNSATTRNLTGISKYNNFHVAVGDDGSMNNSVNYGVSWTTGSLGYKLNAITNYNGAYYYVGTNGRIYYTSDAVYAFLRTTNTDKELFAITNDKNTFVAVGDCGTVVKSAGGTTWTLHNAPTSKALRGVTFSNGTYVAVGDFGTIVKSTNGTTWTNCTSDTTRNLYGITNYNGAFWAVGECGTILKSNDGSTWTSINSNTTSILYSISNYNGTFIAAGECGTILSSANGLDWFPTSQDASKLYNSVNTDDGRSIIVGERGTILTRDAAASVVTTKPGDKKATISFDPIVGAVRYKVTATPINGGVEISQEVTGCSITLTGLVNELEYKVKVTGYNSTNIPFLPVVATKTVIPSVAAGLTWSSVASGTTLHIRDTVYNNGKFVLVGDGGTIRGSNLTSEDPTWSNYNSGTTTRLSGITYGNNKYVAVGQDTVLTATPSDPSTWTKQNLNTTANLSAITYGNGLYVAVGRDKIVTSSDATIWAAQTSPTLSDIIYGGGYYVAVGEAGKILTSTTPTDSSQWVTRTTGITNSLYSIAYGDGKYVAVGEAGKILTSTDLINWYPQVSGIGTTIYKIKYEAGMFIATGVNGVILTSSNGVKWYNQLESETNHVLSVAFGNNKFVAVGINGMIKAADYYATASVPTGITIAAGNKQAAVSFIPSTGNVSSYIVTATPKTGGATITQNGTSSAITITGLENEVEYAITVTAYDTLGNPSQPSSPQNIIPSAAAGLKWTALSSGVYSNFTSSVFHDGKFVLVSGPGSIMSSTLSPTDSTWLRNDSQSTTTFSDIVYGKGRYVATVYNGAIVATTPDNLSNWNLQTLASNSTFNGITYGNDIFVAVGSNVIGVSSNGINWSNYNPNAYLEGITYGNGNYVAVGSSGKILTTITPANSASWTSQSSGTYNKLYAVAYGNDKYVTVGDSGLILSSTDLVHWIPQVSGTLNNLVDVKYEAGMFIAVGCKNTILTSVDGVTWYKQEDSSNSILNTISYGNGKFLIAGNSGQIKIAEFITTPPIATVSALTTSGSITAGTNADIKLTLSDNTYSGTMNVTAKGYLPAPDGTFGSLTYPTGSTTSAISTLSAVSTSLGNVYFSNGVANIKLQLNAAVAQPDIQFSVSGVATPDTDKVLITPVADTVTTLVLDQNVTSTITSGAIFKPSPKVTLKDKFGNICTNSTDTIIATKKDSGTWSTIGASAIVSGGSVTFDGLGANNLSSADITTAQYTFSISGQAGGPSVDSNTFTILAPIVTTDITLELTSVTPVSSGSTISVGGTTYTGNVNLVNGTTSVMLTSHLAAGQSVVIGGMEGSFVTQGGTATNPTFTINTASISSGGSKTFTVTVKEAGRSDKVYSVTVAIQPFAADMPLMLTTVTPTSAGNTINVGGGTYTGNVILANGTTSVMLTGLLELGQSAVIGGADSSSVTQGGTATNPTFTVNTNSISNGGSKTFTVTVKEANRNDKVYTITVTVSSLLTVTATSDGVQPIAGSVKTIKLTVYNDVGAKDYTFTGLKAVNLTGYKAAPDGTFGNVTYPTSSTSNSSITLLGGTPSAISTMNSVYFLNGEANLKLVLNAAELQTISVKVDEISIPAQIAVTPLPATTKNMVLDTTILGPDVNGSLLRTMPMITLKDQFGNICTNDTTTKVYASNIGYWKLSGTTNKYASDGTGIINFDDLKASSSMGFPHAILEFSSSKLDKVYSNEFNIPAPAIEVLENGTNWEESNVGFSRNLKGVTYGYNSTGAGLFVAVGDSGIIVNSYDKVVWNSKANPDTNNRNLKGITYGSNGLFVAVGDSGTILVSSDGEVWRKPSSVPADISSIALYGVTYGNANSSRMFVIVGQGGVILTSTDGEVWSKCAGARTALYSVANGDGKFVAVGANGRAWESTDGATWKPCYTVSSVYLRGITYEGGVFYAVGDDTSILRYSVDAGSGSWLWTAIDAANIEGYSGLQLSGIQYSGNTLISVGEAGTVVKSTDGLNWNTKSSGTGFDLASITTGKDATGKDVILAVGNNGGIYVTSYIVKEPDAPLNITATPGNKTAIIEFDAPEFDGGSQIIEYIVVNNNGEPVASGRTSPITVSNLVNGVQYDFYVIATNVAGQSALSNSVSVTPLAIWDKGIQWDGNTPILNKTLYSIAQGNNNFVTVGDGGLLLTSPSDVINWKIENSGVDNTLYGVTYGGGIYVAVGSSGQIITSTNGSNWTSRKSEDMRFTLNAVAYGDGTFVAVGTGGNILTSLNGINWVPATSGTIYPLYGVAYGNGHFVVVGANGKVLTSTDGIHWAIRPIGIDVNGYLKGVVYDNSNFIIVGDFGVILTSKDGITWSNPNSGVEANINAVTYTQNTYLAVGGMGTILTSADGSDWTLRNSGITDSLQGIVHFGGRYVAVGEKGILTTSLVASPPGQPQNVSAIVGRDKAIISFDLPETDGGSAITGYEVVNEMGQVLAIGDRSPITLTGLSEKSTYILSVIAINLEGRSIPSEQVFVSPSSAINVPGMPQDVTAIAGNNQALISFTAPVTDGGSPITGYQISNDEKVIATGKESPILVTLNNGLAYTLEVAAVNIQGVGAGKAVTVNPLNTITIPSEPQITAYSIGNGKVSISFESPLSNGGSPIIGYEVFSGAEKIASGTQSPIIITGLTNNRMYTLALSAVNIQGNSALSTPITVTPMAVVTVPDPPLNLTAVAGNEKANLSFNLGSDGGNPITEYIVTDNGNVLRNISSSAIIVSNGKGSILLEGLSNLTTYNLRLIARNINGVSVPSNSVTLIPIGAVVQAPGILNNVIATAGDGKAVISFDPPDTNGGSSITGYKVFKDGIAVASSSNSPIIVTGLENDVCHTLTVAAINIEGPGVSTTVQVTPSAIGIVPDPPQNLSVVVGNAKALISFDTGSDGNSQITEYIILNNGSEFRRIDVADVDLYDGRNNILLTNLTNGTTYNLRIVAVNANSSVGSVASEQIYVRPKATVTVPSPPRNIAYTLGNGKVFINFDAGSNGGSPILEYKVYSGTDVVATGKQSPIAVESLINYQIYNFTVVARNIEGDSIPSQSITVKPIIAITVPEPPKNIVASSGREKAVIEFQSPDFDGGSPIIGYEVVTNNGTVKATGNVSPIIVTGLNNGIEYQFKVVAINAKGKSVPSATVKVTPTSAATVPDPPQNVVAKAGINKAMISFNQGSDGGSRILAYIVSSDDGNISVAGNGSPITITGLENDTTYSFNVIAINAEGMSLPSASVNVIPTDSASTPDTPENITALAGNGKAVISFDQGFDGGYAITKYRVINEATSWSTTTDISSVAVSGVRRSMVISNLTNGVEYKFRVIAINSNNDESAPSAIASVRPSAVIAKPSTPTNLSAIAGDTFIIVSFSKGANSESNDYKVVLDNGDIVIAKDSPILITGLENGISYTLTMSATNTEGESDPSNSVTVQTLVGASTISPPQNVIATAGNSKAIIGFTESVFNGGSEIKEYRIINDNNQIVATGLQSPITVNGLVNGTQYYFRVVAVNEDGVLSTPSSRVLIIPTSVASAPDAPENVVAIAGLNKAILCFNQGSDGGSAIKGYEVIKQDGSLHATFLMNNVIVSGTRRSLTVTGLVNDEEYNFRVVAINDKGYSVPSAAVSVIPTSETTIPSQPINLIATSGNSSAVLSFDIDSDGGMPISKFVIKEDGGFPDTTIDIADVTIIGSRYFLTVPELTNNAAYNFRVIAVNTNGNSLVSNPVTITPCAENIGGLTGYVKIMNVNRLGITVTIKSSGAVYTVQTDNTGKFECKNIAAGTYSVEISKPGYITRTINNVIVQSLLRNVSYSENPIDLIPGDVTGDNTVSYDDLLLLMAAYNTVDTDVKYTANADFNVSKSINSIDLSALMGSYNKTQSSYTAWVIPNQWQ